MNYLQKYYFFNQLYDEICSKCKENCNFVKNNNKEYVVKERATDLSRNRVQEALRGMKSAGCLNKVEGKTYTEAYLFIKKIGNLT